MSLNNQRNWRKVFKCWKRADGIMLTPAILQVRNDTNRATKIHRGSDGTRGSFCQLPFNFILLRDCEVEASSLCLHCFPVSQRDGLFEAMQNKFGIDVVTIKGNQRTMKIEARRSPELVWTLIPDDRWNAIEDENGRTVCHVYALPENEEGERDEIAELILNAPETLTRLKQAEHLIDRCTQDLDTVGMRRSHGRMLKELQSFIKEGE